jgi:hypothetical protein
VWMLCKLTYANVMSTVAVFIALGGGAFAASKFVGSHGVVSLCVSSNGNVKVLAQKKRCAKHTQLVSVNTRGVAGPRGPAGTTGATGATGAPGASGVATGYTAGPGLTISGSVLSADLGVVQARIAGSGCASDQALQSVAQTGSPTCTGLHAYSATVGTDVSQADIAIPPGQWALFGRITAGGAGSPMIVSCEIHVAAATVATASQSIPTSANGSVSLFATTTTTTKPATPINTSCATDGALPTWSNGTIVAIPVAALN